MRSIAWIALALSGLSAPALAQVGVYDAEPSTTTLGAAARRGEGVRISGHARSLLIPETYTVRSGDTLWDVTGRFYGNPWEWPRVWSYNPEITNPHWIYPLDQLRLLAPGTERAVTEPVSGPRIVRSRQREAPGTVFLRQQGYLDPEALAQAGVIVGSPEDHMMLAPYDSLAVEFAEGARGRRERHAGPHLRHGAHRLVRSGAAHGARDDHRGARSDRARLPRRADAAAVRSRPAEAGRSRSRDDGGGDVEAARALGRPTD